MQTIDEKAPALAQILHHVDQGSLLQELEEYCRNLPRMAQERGVKTSVSLAVQFAPFDQQKVATTGKLTVKEPEKKRTEAILFVTDTGLSRQNPLQVQMALDRESD